MAEKSELEQTHCVVSKVFAFSVPPLGSADGFKASLWPKQPIWVGRLRVVSRNDKCAVLLEHTEKDGLFASCPIQNAQTVESAIDSSRYFVLRLSDGKGRHALIGIGFNDRAQAFDFKVALQDWQNHNQDGGVAAASAAAAAVPAGPASDYSIPQGGSIHVTFGGGGAKKKAATGADVSTALSGMKLDAPPAKGSDADKERKKEKKKKKEAAAAAAAAAAGAGGFSNTAAAQSIVGSSSSSSATAAAPASNPNIIDFGFGDFDPLSTPKQQQQPAQANNNRLAEAPRRASVVDPFAQDAAPAFGATPFDTPFDDTPNDWVKF